MEGKKLRYLRKGRAIRGKGRLLSGDGLRWREMEGKGREIGKKERERNIGGKGREIKKRERERD